MGIVWFKFRNDKMMVWWDFYGISTIVGYLMPDPLDTYILNIYHWVWLAFMAYQSL